MTVKITIHTHGHGYPSVIRTHCPEGETVEVEARSGRTVVIECVDTADAPSDLAGEAGLTGIVVEDSDR